MLTTVDVLGVPHAYELTPVCQPSTVLVFIHGWLLSRAYWKPIIERLALDYQCLSYDLRGFGDSQINQTRVVHTAATPQQSSLPVMEGQQLRFTIATETINLLSSTDYTASEQKPMVFRGTAQRIAPLKTMGFCSDRLYSPATYAQDLIALLQTLDIKHVWLVGHSLGGSIALWAADLYPDCVKGVICVNSGGGIYLKEEFERFRAAGEQLVKMRPRWLCYLPLVDLILTRMNVARPLSRQWGRQRLLDLVMAHPEAALGALLESTTEEDVHSLPQLVSRLQQPVYFIAGAEDSIMEPQYVRHLASFHPLFQCCGDNVTEIADCGHLAMVEQPDQVADHLRLILQKHGMS